MEFNYLFLFFNHCLNVSKKEENWKQLAAGPDLPIFNLFF